MSDKSIHEWVITGVKWYGIIVLGGTISLGRSTGWLLHDVWCRMRRIDSEEKYIIGKSTTKQSAAAILTLLAIVMHIMNILLIAPMLMGLQHLMRNRKQVKQIQEESKNQAVKEVNHWHDGIAYAVGIDPMGRRLREIAAAYIVDDSKVIDIACGTGAFVFYIAERCKQVTGVDHSIGMINYANKEKRSKGLTDVEFVCADAANLSLYQDHIFDYAVLSFTIHEMPPPIRLPVLREAIRIAEQVIIADYTIPMPMNSAGMINLYLEFTAGYDHLRGFLNFRDHRGLDSLIEEAGLRVEEETTGNQGTWRFVKARMAST